MVAEGYLAGQACQVAGISYRQLDYWDRTGLLSPGVSTAHGTGSVRLYSFCDLVALRVIKRLEEGGIPLQTIRRAIRYLQENLPFLESPFTDVTLVTDGKTIFALCRDEQEIIDVLRGGQLVFTVALGDIVAELEGKVSDMATLPSPVTRRRHVAA